MGVKDIFKKSRSKLVTLKTVAPGLARPPAPSVTRWGKWLTAIDYYADDFKRENILKVLEKAAEKTGSEF